MRRPSSRSPGGTRDERRRAMLTLAAILLVATTDATAALVQALHDPDGTVRSEAHDSLWAIWHRSGDPAIDARLTEGIGLMQSGQLSEAITVFSDVIAR